MQQPTSPIMERLQSSDPAVREAAIRELATSSDRGAIIALQHILSSDPEPRLRKLAADAAMQIQNNANKSGGNAGQSAFSMGGSAAMFSTAKPKTYQMLWACPFCGTKKLLGLDHRHCPNCGAAQKPEWRYFPSDADKKFVDDPNYEYAGVDKECPFCHQPNSALAKFCVSCGGDLTNAKAVTLKDHVLAGSTADTGQAEDLVLKKFQAEQTAIKGKKGNSALPRILIALVILAVVIGGGLFALSKITHPGSFEVSGVTWERTISIEQLEPLNQVSWQESVPGDAYNRSCYSKQRSYQESESYACGVVHVDNGNGTGRDETKYCTRSITKYRTDTECSYTVDRWQHLRDLTTQGGQNDALVWPNFTSAQTAIIGAQREQSRQQTLQIVFKDVSKSDSNATFNYDLHDDKDIPKWQSFKVSQRYEVKINALNQVLWDTLKLVSPG